MTAIICKWLNEDVRLSQTAGARPFCSGTSYQLMDLLDEDTFSKEFSNGYLFAEVLSVYNVLGDLTSFSKAL